MSPFDTPLPPSEALSPEDVALTDAWGAALLPLAPPPALVAQVQAAMAAEVAAAAPAAAPAGRVVPLPAARRRRWMGAAAALAVAALALVVVWPGTPAPDTSQLVERGLGGARMPELSLKVAVDRGGTVDRLRQDQPYRPGDQLYFRVGVDTPAQVHLVRLDADGVAVVHTQALQAGEADLRLADGPLAWRLEPGEGDAVFALVATAAPAAQVEAALSGAYDPAQPTRACTAALAVGARCEATLVRVHSP